MNSMPESSSETGVVSYTKAIAEIRSRMESCSTVAIYSFNIPQDELKQANALLDEQNGRKSMRVSYNDDFNFIVKYMPSAAHEIAHTFWMMAFLASMGLLAGTNSVVDLGYIQLGATTFGLSPDKSKQADGAIAPSTAPNRPTVIIEVGDSESLMQLRIDARLWIESENLDVQLVVIICIDPPLPQTNLNLPRITIQHWKPSPPSRPIRTSNLNAPRKEAQMVWQANWTNGVTPGYYIPLADVFLPGGIPAVYGNATQAIFAHVDLMQLRHWVINRWQAVH